MQAVKGFGDRLNELTSLADKTIATETSRSGGNATVDYSLFVEFRTATLSFILNLYGKEHPYYEAFLSSVHYNRPSNARAGRAILNSIKSEFDGGWLTSMKGLISAELFSDFLEMADHLLSQKYKDAAAVIIGSVLEEHLRQLSVKNGLAIEDVDSKTGKQIPKKAEILNTQLRNNEVYHILDQKNVTAWFDLRNKAAHGKYDEYLLGQVEIMSQSVRDFITRNKI